MARRTPPKPDEDLGLTVEDLFADTLTFTTRFWKGKPLTITWSVLAFTAAVEDRIEAIRATEVEEPDEDDEGEVGDEAAQARRKLERDVAAHKRRRLGAAASRAVVSELVVAWSLRQKDGTPHPLDEASLRRLPDPFIDGVLDALNEAAGPKGESESPSSDS